MKFRTFLLISLVIGMICGVILPEGATYFAFLGKIFLNLLRVIIIPLIFISCFLAFAGVKNTRLLKDLGIRTVSYYAVTSTMACIIGIVCAYIFLGIGSTSFVPKSAVNNLESFSFEGFILNFFPSNFFSSLSDGNIIHIVIISLAVGLATHFIGANEKNTIVKLATSINSLVMVVVHAIILLSPIGVFSLVYSSISKLDLNDLATFKSFVGASIVAAIIHSCISLPIILKMFGKVSPFTFFLKVKDALVVAISTASSSGTLPVSTSVLIDNAKIDKRVVGFVLPLGATLNMDGSALYQSIAVIFMGKMAGMDFTFLQVVMTFILIMFSSAGTAGIPGGGIAMMSMVMGVLGIPLEYIGIYILVDRFLDYPITAINVWGDLVGGQVVASGKLIGPEEEDHVDGKQSF